MQEHHTYIYWNRIIWSLRIGFGFYLVAFGFQSALPAQDYFKRLHESDNYLNQQITHFPGGDLLIGDSSVEAVRTGSGGEIYLTRMDACGEVLWSRSYRSEEEYIELKDLIISETNEIFVYGSAYIGLDELIFFLKLDGMGNVQAFRFFQPETVDHFTYNIDLQDGRLLAYGLILDFSTKKFGFVALFDDNLNFMWGKKFTPFASSGGARITQDEGFICRSGTYLFKLDRVGELEWATELSPNDQNSPVSGPIEVSDGYILQATGNDFSFFYKVNLRGELVWKSPQYPSKSFPAEMILLPNDDISAVYSSDEEGRQELRRLRLSPQGAIRSQEVWIGTVSIKPGRVYQSWDEAGHQVISGNPDQSVPGDVDVPGFLLQSGETAAPETCFEWMPLQSIRPNEVDMDFSRLDTIVSATEMRLLNNTNIRPAPFDILFENACSVGPDRSLVQVDTFLECDEQWTVMLPSAEFYWLDDQTEHPRILSIPGVYQARNEDCSNPVIYEYVLEKPNCRCNTYLPTAFSPNQDGRNDLLEFFAGCELTAVEWIVFSRWGEKVFESRVPGQFWDGNFRSRPAPNGLYLVSLRYEWLDQDGRQQKNTIRQRVSLIR